MFLERFEVTKPAADRREVLSLVQVLTSLPPTVVQAASFINVTRQAVKSYLELLKESESEVIQLLKEDFGGQMRYPDAKNPIASTWLLSFERIRRRSPLAASFLSYPT
ncbi:uncharacterized protein A1O5_07070 [Cladophialophora psammophila CBS 110553]|uniref:Uncharacterized protein n=1 Tax=Cladophialophora psammophila CBS 110553 TaxID=1182543 RepID=W9WP94_9EURO|nr:uncharacterized protein A1O5_07070 [Cladophialophora psammophila CBS 110553]EXJ69997.1 hypothetical protein A1O5_07070 [Cladophialophora psammophila CBS 110553]